MVRKSVFPVQALAPAAHVLAFAPGRGHDLDHRSRRSTSDRFVALVDRAGIGCLVDVRAHPGLRRQLDLRQAFRFSQRGDGARGELG